MSAPNTDILTRSRGAALVPTQFSKNVQPKSKRGPSYTEGVAKFKTAAMKHSQSKVIVVKGAK